MQSVSIRYSTAMSRTLVRLLKWTSIVWCVIPLLWLLFGSMTYLVELGKYFVPGQSVGTPYQTLLAFLCFAIAPLATLAAGSLLMLVFLDDRIIVSRQGLVLPLSLCVQFYCHRNRSWGEVQKSKLIKRGGKNICLKLTFKDGHFVVFEANEMADDDLNKLLIASRTLTPTDEREAEALANSEDAAKIPLDISTFTSLWESELTLRYRATTYVPLLPGQILLNGVVVHKALSYGGSSAIYLARRKDGKVVILKEFVIADGLPEENRKKALEMFKKEAILLAKLKHKDIAQIYDHFVENGRHYVILQYIPGEDLRRLVSRRGAIAEKNVCHWLRHLTQVLIYLSQQAPPIVHRDMTPENIVLRPKGGLALIDFGAANEFIGTATGTVVGKQGYIAPEQFRGKAIPKSDIYALGCTAFFLLTGQEPEALRQSLPKKINNQISDNMNDLVMQMTCQNPDERPDAEQVLKSLEMLGLYKESYSISA